MSRRKTAILFHRTLQSSRAAQVVLLAIVWLLGEAVARTSGIPVLGAVIGLFGIGAHRAGVAKANQIGAEEGSVAGLVMVLVDLINVLAAPLLAFVLR